MSERVEHHYAHGALVHAIAGGLVALGKAPPSVGLDDLAAVDEFHIGGRLATEAVVGQLGLSRDLHVLDVGSGLGGGARFVASRYGCRVTGLDLVAEYVEAARVLGEWTGLAGRVRFARGSALAMPFAAASFDAAYMLHVGMNIPDKARLFGEVARVLRPGGPFGVYDVMATGEGALAFPVPWASTPELSAVATPAAYRTALRASGFELVAERDRRALALEFFRSLRARLAQAGGPPPLGLHLLMGPEAGTKVGNMIASVEAGLIVPVEMIARRLG